MHVVLHAGNPAQIRQALERNLPAIAFLSTGDLPYWQDNVSHAVVVVGYDNTTCYLNDPAFTVAPQAVHWDEFMLAWSEMDYAYVLITR